MTYALFILPMIGLALFIWGEHNYSTYLRRECLGWSKDWNRLYKLASRIRERFDARGQRIAVLQDALTYWRRRAADKTAEVHRLRRALRGLGIDDRRLP